MTNLFKLLINVFVLRAECKKGDFMARPATFAQRVYLFIPVGAEEGAETPVGTRRETPALSVYR